MSRLLVSARSEGGTVSTSDLRFLTAQLSRTLGGATSDRYIDDYTSQWIASG